MQQEVQSTPSCLGYVSGPATGPTVTKAVPCVENRRWTFKNVTYVTLNVQGSCNNLCDTAPDQAEFAARNAADIAWLHETFTQAKANGSVAVMIISQADPGFDGSDGTRAPVRNPKTLAEISPNPNADGYQSFLVAVRDETIAFGRPVAYVHGDSHYFRVDKPLQDANGQAPRELHSGRDVRRQRGQRAQRRALGQGTRRPAEPRRLRLPGADGAGQHRGALTRQRHDPLADAMGPLALLRGASSRQAK